MGPPNRGMGCMGYDDIVEWARANGAPEPPEESDGSDDYDVDFDLL